MGLFLSLEAGKTPTACSPLLPTSGIFLCFDFSQIWTLSISVLIRAGEKMFSGNCNISEGAVCLLVVPVCRRVRADSSLASMGILTPAHHGRSDEAHGSGSAPSGSHQPATGTSRVLPWVSEPPAPFCGGGAGVWPSPGFLRLSPAGGSGRCAEPRVSLLAASLGTPTED